MSVCIWGDIYNVQYFIVFDLLSFGPTLWLIRFSDYHAYGTLCVPWGGGGYSLDSDDRDDRRIF